MLFCEISNLNCKFNLAEIYNEEATRNDSSDVIKYWGRTAVIFLSKIRKRVVAFKNLFLFLKQGEQLRARLLARKKLLEEVAKEKAVAKQLKKVTQKNQVASAAAQKALEHVEQAELLQSAAEDQLVEAQVRFLIFFCFWETFSPTVCCSLKEIDCFANLSLYSTLSLASSSLLDFLSFLSNVVKS